MPVIDLEKSFFSLSETSHGGLTVTQEMKDILSQPGFISTAKGGKKLRNLYVDGRPRHTYVFLEQTDLPPQAA